MDIKQQLALELGRKFKRLRYWQQGFKSATLSEQHKSEITALLDTYALLISKISKEEDATAIQEAMSRLSTVERQLTTLFEDFRLATSALNAH